MASRFKVSCDRCSFAAFLGTGAEQYLLPDGSTAFAEVYAGWCPDCQGISVGEYIPTEDELHAKHQRILARLDDPAIANPFSQRSASFDRDATVRIVENVYQARLAWRRLRTSPAHCLRCSSARHVRFLDVDFGQPCAQHPGCLDKGQLSMVHVAFMSTSFVDLSVEGHPI